MKIVVAGAVSVKKGDKISVCLKTLLVPLERKIIQVLVKLKDKSIKVFSRMLMISS